MKTRKFGKTGVEVGEIGMGCWAIGGNEHGNSYGPTDDKASIAAVRKAFEMGCNFFDTADVYGHGHSEEVLGIALKDVRDKVFIATKVGGDFYSQRGGRNFTPLYIGFALNNSLQRLQTDYVDLYQLHNPTLRMIERGDILEHMSAHKGIGQIRWYGASVFTPEEALAALEAGPPDALQIPYNIFQSGGWDAVFEAAKEKGCAIIAREPLANGYLAGKFTGDENFPEGDIRRDMPADYKKARAAAAAELKKRLEIPGRRTLAQAAIRFALLPDAVSVVIVGAKTAAQVAENLAASDAPPLTDKEIKSISDILGGSM
jgi:aryl-alcohol dehydrogenase-like predicted oxidoreductase